MEFEYAKKLKKPMFSLVASDEFVKKRRKKIVVKLAEAKKVNTCGCLRLSGR